MHLAIAYNLELDEKKIQELNTNKYVKLLDYANHKKHFFKAKNDSELLLRQFKNYKKKVIPVRGLYGQSLYAYITTVDFDFKNFKLSPGYSHATDPYYVGKCISLDKEYCLYFIHLIPTRKLIFKEIRSVYRNMR